MKILLVCPYFREPHRWMISAYKTALYLSKQHEVVVVTTGQPPLEVVNERLKIYRLRDWFLPDPVNYSIIPSLFHRVRAVIKTEQPQAFLINKHMFFSSLAIWPIKWMGHKVVVQSDTFPGINWFPKNKLVRLVMWVYARLIGNPILRAADKVVLLHEGLIEDAKRLGLNYEVIHNGVDLAEFDTTPIPKDLVKKKGEIWIGYVGRLESVKGWYDLAAVAQQIVPQHPHVHFFFIGPTHNAEEKIKEFAHPQIHFLGLRQDVAGIDKLLDIFVMPSLSEGLSNAIMEAMAASCACVVSRTGGNMILVQEGINGRLFEPGDTADLQRTLGSLLTDTAERTKLGVAARHTIESSYSLPDNVAKLAQIFHTL